MHNNILSGNNLAKTYKNKIKNSVELIKRHNYRAPALAAILVGNLPQSLTYLKHKQSACHEVGINSFLYNLPEDISHHEISDLIHKLNNDTTIDGILLQLPLPDKKLTNPLLQTICPHKDVDGFHPINIGNLLQDQAVLSPCTPKGIIKLLEHTQVDLTSKHAVVVGSSNIVGKPMILELLNKKCTITNCHAATVNLPQYIKQADILISATGQGHLVQADWIKTGAIVIDVGISYDNTGNLIGDVDFNNAREKASWITPVPGGVGPMTVAMLLENTLIAFCVNNNLDLNFFYI